MTDALRTRHRLFALALPLSAALYLGAEGLDPKGTDRIVTTTAVALERVPIAAKHSAQLYLSGSLSSWRWGGGDLVRRHRHARAPTRLGCGHHRRPARGDRRFCGTVVNVLVGIRLAAASSAHVTRRAAARLLLTNFNSAPGRAFTDVYAFSELVAPIILGLTLWRSRCVPRWLAVLFAAGLAWPAQTGSVGIVRVAVQMAPFVVAIVLPRSGSGGWTTGPTPGMTGSTCPHPPDGYPAPVEGVPASKPRRVQTAEPGEFGTPPRTRCRRDRAAADRAPATPSSAAAGGRRRSASRRYGSRSRRIGGSDGGGPRVRLPPARPFAPERVATSPRACSPRSSPARSTPVRASAPRLRCRNEQRSSPRSVTSSVGRIGNRASPLRPGDGSHDGGHAARGAVEQRAEQPGLLSGGGVRVGAIHRARPRRVGDVQHRPPPRGRRDVPLLRNGGEAGRALEDLVGGRVTPSRRKASSVRTRPPGVTAALPLPVSLDGREEQRPEQTPDLIRPEALALRRHNGDLLLADVDRQQILEWHPRPARSRCSPAPVSRASPATAGPREARLENPGGLALAPDGTLYFVDGNRVRAVSPDGLITTAAGTGRQPVTSAPATGPALETALDPADVAVSTSGTVAIASGSSILELRAGRLSALVSGAGPATPRWSPRAARWPSSRPRWPSTATATSTSSRHRRSCYSRSARRDESPCSATATRRSSQPVRTARSTWPIREKPSGGSAAGR